MPLRGQQPAVREVSSGGIMRGKRAMLERGAPHGIHGGDPKEDTWGTQGPRYLPQDHAVPGYVVDWSVCRPLFRYRSREMILANTTHPGQLGDGGQGFQLEGCQWYNLGDCQIYTGIGTEWVVVSRGCIPQDRTTGHGGSDRKTARNANPRSHRPGMILLQVV